MIRELTITIYLLILQTIFNLFKLFPQRKKTVFVASFGDNVLYTLKELEKQSNQQIIILQTSQCKINFSQANVVVKHFSITNIWQWIQSIYHLATCENVFVDNYFGFLAVTEFKSNVECVQLWHAAGAIKRFGLKDPSVKYRSTRANRRFHRVYQRFTKVIVGSEKMATIFKQSFGIMDERILRSGIPRSDLFYNAQKIKSIKQELMTLFPVIKEKKVILYAPTFRDNELTNAKIRLDTEQLQKEFGNDYVLFMRMHPAIKHDFEADHDNFVYDVSHIPDINHLLMVTDILITDYSSIPFEFSILEKPMIFFAYDLDDYQQSRGFWQDYPSLVPGPVASTTSEVIDIIKEGNFHMQKVKDFANQWNQYSKGKSSETLINTLYTEEEQHKVAEQG